MSGKVEPVSTAMAEQPPVTAHEMQRASGGGDEVVFARRFLANPKRIGSIIPSSSYLERRIVVAADIARSRCVVELGPGTGGTTRALLDALQPSARLLAIELDQHFHERLRRRICDPRLMLSLGSAETMLEQLQSWRLPQPDVVVSGIPFSTMDVAVGKRIAAAIAKGLAPGGRFIAYQVRQRVVDFTTPHLGAPEVRWEARNWPPMRIFCWKKAG
jgi:phospholipid N-methyltransferase